jgi:electron transfer flavoprotein alpha subunit
MAGILVVGEVAGGELTKLSTEVATLARRLAETGGLDVTGVTFGDGPATELARFTGGRVTALDGAPDDVPAFDLLAGAAVAAGGDPDYVLLGASPDGRDAAGRLAATVPAAVLSNATAVEWSDDGPVVAMSVFGGKLVTRSAFTSKPGIITVRSNVVTAEPATTSGSVEKATPAEDGAGPKARVRVVDRIAQEGAAASIDDARVIVAGGRGVGGEEGFRLLGDLADALGGAVGATRAAVDAGWIDYSQQIGQTGKIVKPQLYLALGISGAIQHKVGMQTADTIVAVNRDPDAPIAEFADLVVLGDLFEIGPALLAQLRERGR